MMNRFSRAKLQRMKGAGGSRALRVRELWGPCLHPEGSAPIARAGPGTRSALGALRGEAGFTIIEVLITALVVGTAIVGMTVMLTFRSAWMDAMGDDRVADGLAQQKTEKLRAAGFAAAAEGNPDPTSAHYVSTYEENRNGRLWEAPAPLTARPFMRLTCVQYVLDADNQFGPGTGTALYSPAYVGNIDTNMPCDPYVNTATAPVTSCAVLGPTCVDTTKTKRITVVITPDLNNQHRKSDRVSLQAWVQ